MGNCQPKEEKKNKLQKGFDECIRRHEIKNFISLEYFRKTWYKLVEWFDSSESTTKEKAKELWLKAIEGELKINDLKEATIKEKTSGKADEEEEEEEVYREEQGQGSDEVESDEKKKGDEKEDDGLIVQNQQQRKKQK